jgi:hypothetical protein
LISLRATRPEDIPALSSLFAQRFGHPLSAEEWAWKYRQLPGESRSLVAVEASGRVLAHAGALRLPARWRGGEAGIWQLVDFAGSADRRGLRPALVELGRLLLADLPGDADVPLIFGFPSERHFRLGLRVFDYHPLATVEPLGGALPGAPAPAAARIEAGDFCASWAEAAWERCAPLGVRRSTAFLNWRYHSRPGRYYRVYRLPGGDGEGLAVFAFVGDEAWAAELWLPPAGEWYPSMLAVAADLRGAGLRTWRFWPPYGPHSGLLASLGLQPAGESRFVGCRGRAGGSDPSAAADGFYFAMGDYDLV